MKVDESDIDMIKYFWQEKGDIERFSSWSELLPALKENYPHLISAWENYKRSEKILNCVVNNLEFKEQP